MKTINTLLVSSVIALAAHAQEPLEEIVRKRDIVLTEILEAAKKRGKGGGTTGAEVRDATIRLYSFRRDSAKSHAERIKWQELIVAAEKEDEPDIKRRIAVGAMTRTDALLAEERVLAAEQKLAELRLEK